jgi:hypothetical protein
MLPESPGVRRPLAAPSSVKPGFSAGTPLPDVAAYGQTETEERQRGRLGDGVELRHESETIDPM